MLLLSLEDGGNKHREGEVCGASNGPRHDKHGAHQFEIFRYILIDLCYRNVVG